MGTEALWIGAALAAAGGAVNEVNNRRTARKQDEELARGIRENAKVQREANERLNTVVDKTAESSAEPFRSERMNSMQQRIANKRAQALASIAQGGNTSDAAKAMEAAAGVTATDYAGGLADLFSIIDAAGEQRLAEGNLRSNASMDLSRLSGDAGQNTFLAQMRARRHRPNPLLGIAGAALSGAGTAYASGGFGGGGPSHTPNAGPSYPRNP